MKNMNALYLYLTIFYVILMALGSTYPQMEGRTELYIYTALYIVSMGGVYLWSRKK